MDRKIMEKHGQTPFSIYHACMCVGNANSNGTVLSSFSKL